MSISVELTAASIQYLNSDKPTFQNVDLLLPANSWTCLLGPSGCGKTSLLRLLAGLIDERHHIQGEIHCSDKQSLTNRISYMAQQDLLLPWLNVIDNVCLKARLTTKKVNTKERAKAHSLLQELNLEGIEKSFPDQLSGGMRQRVALARTLMQDTPVVLMDEPFSALDAITRYKLQNLAAKVLKGRTVLLITHDPQEALRLSDQLYLFNKQQQLSALELPNSQTPRIIDGELSDYQQRLLNIMQVQYD
jgi:putative hydroxymethylpyrimidine transport system ATP-binding protein